MLYDEVVELDKRFRLIHYRSLFGRIKDKAGSLSATESFSVDAIYLLNEPTIKQFADYLGISQPNATYKVNSLIEKGYITKIPSTDDRREYRLQVSEKFFKYYDVADSVITDALDEITPQFSEDELKAFETVLKALNREIEPKSEE